IARVHEDPSDPGVEVVRIAESAKVAPGGDQRLPGCVGRALRVTGEKTGDGVEPVDPETSQLRERLVIARLRPFDELPHTGPLGRCSVDRRTQSLRYAPSPSGSIFGRRPAQTRKRPDARGSV